MSQRLISKRIHPRTGECVTPLFYNEDGVPFWPILGAAPDDDDSDDDGDDSDDDDDDDGSDDGSEGRNSGNGKQDDAVTKEDFEALSKRMKAADRRASEAEKKVKEYEDKDKDEATKSAERITALETENGTLKKDLGELRLQNAFLASNDMAWHDPELALSKADLSEAVNEDGEIDKKALKKALKEVSEKFPFLVKKSEDGDEDDSDEGGSSGSPSRSGDSVGSGRRKNKKGADEATLRHKYPALMR